MKQNARSDLPLFGIKFCPESVETSQIYVRVFLIDTNRYDHRGESNTYMTL